MIISFLLIVLSIVITSANSQLFCDKKYRNKLIDAVFNSDDNTVYAYRQPSSVWILKFNTKDNRWEQYGSEHKLNEMFSGLKSGLIPSAGLVIWTYTKCGDANNCLNDNYYFTAKDITFLFIDSQFATFKRQSEDFFVATELNDRMLPWYLSRQSDSSDANNQTNTIFPHFENTKIKGAVLTKSVRGYPEGALIFSDLEIIEYPVVNIKVNYTIRSTIDPNIGIYKTTRGTGGIRRANDIFFFLKNNVYKYYDTSPVLVDQSKTYWDFFNCDKSSNGITSTSTTTTIKPTTPTTNMTTESVVVVSSSTSDLSTNVTQTTVSTENITLLPLNSSTGGQSINDTTIMSSENNTIYTDRQTSLDYESRATITSTQTTTSSSLTTSSIFMNISIDNAFHEVVKDMSVILILMVIIVCLLITTCAVFGYISLSVKLSKPKLSQNNSIKQTNRSLEASVDYKVVIMQNKYVAFGALGVVGLVLIVSGALVLGLFPRILKNKIIEGSLIVNTSQNFKNWKEVPLPALMKFYVFVLKNPQTYTNLEDVELEERGPWVFEEWRSKEQINFFTGPLNESLVSYRERRKYIFKPDLSSGTFDENLTFINAPMMSVLFNQVMPDASMAFDLFKDELDDNEKSLFTTRKAGDLLLDGVDLKLAKLVAPLIPPDLGFEMKKFSVTGGRDYLIDRLTVYTGVGRTDKLGQIYQWEDSRELRNGDKKKSPIWPYHDPNGECLQLRGTDGTFFGPDVSENDKLFAFDPSVCRSVAVIFQKESEVKGIPTLRFVAPNNFFGAAKYHKENSCYCLRKDVNDCNIEGVLELSHCMRQTAGGPLLLSWPYFLNGDESLKRNIKLQPPKDVTFDNYGTFIDIEPTTGGPLNAIKRMQMNVRIGYSDAIP
ncbi:uncharacterized protein LOC128958187 [Oppia nitens]|uniref:uncharacterized protein LOC128958187 n=1 Tax=Oppia nitens TaxID=1686743 RepID=UPI0023D9A780|nr:uncharacterized protein LOC128958187 [Oppia nitens]